jgi:SAM-dependent methyltransferase
VLEVADNSYTVMFGRGVTRSDVLNLHGGIEGTTVVDDLTQGAKLASNSFDCVILTQTLNLIFDTRAALRTVHRILKPGGVVLCTVPGITQISYEGWNDSWYWGLTTNSASRLAGEVFPQAAVEIGCYGNVLSATAFLQGLADRELTCEELDVVDPEYQVIVAFKATKQPVARGG